MQSEGHRCGGTAHAGFHCNHCNIATALTGVAGLPAATYVMEVEDASFGPRGC